MPLRTFIEKVSRISLIRALRVLIFYPLYIDGIEMDVHRNRPPPDIVIHFIAIYRILQITHFRTSTKHRASNDKSIL